MTPHIIVFRNMDTDETLYATTPYPSKDEAEWAWVEMYARLDRDWTTVYAHEIVPVHPPLELIDIANREASND